MIYPLFQLFTARPQLLLDHAEGYTALIAAEVRAASAWWTRRAALCAAALCSGCIALVLGGVAAMLWATLPIASMQAPWVLVATPLLPAAVSLCCAIATAVQAGERHFGSLREQVQADMAMLREATAP
jgi:hypothetical protein